MQSALYKSRPVIGGNQHTWSTDAFPDPNKTRGSQEWKLNLKQSFILQYSFVDQDGNPMDLSGQTPAPNLYARVYGNNTFGTLNLGAGLVDADPADGGVVQNRITFTVAKDWGVGSGLETFEFDRNGAIVLFTEIQDADEYFAVRERLNVEDPEFVGTGQTVPAIPIVIAYSPTYPTDWAKYGGAVPDTNTGALDKLAEAGKSDWGSVESITTTAPPVTPVRGERYIVPVGATGDWAGQDGMYAIWDSVGLVWTFVAPFDGMEVIVLDEGTNGVRYRYFGSTWATVEVVTDHALLSNLTVGNPHTQYLLLAGGTLTGAVLGVVSADPSAVAINSDVDAKIANAIAGKTDQGVVDTRAVNPPAHGAGVRVLIDGNLGAGTGDFAGQENKIANSDGVSVWTFETPAEGWFVWVDDENKQYSYDDDATNWFASAAGETNTASNVGTGIDQFKQKVGVDFQFHKNLGTEGILVQLTGDDVEYKLNINSLASEASPATGMKLVLWDGVSAHKIIDWNQLPTGDTMLNVGTGIGVYKQQVGNTFELHKLISANSNIAIALNGDDIQFTLADADESTVGVSRFATDAEVKAGALNTVGVSPLNLLANFVPRKLELGAVPSGSRTVLSSDEGKAIRADTDLVVPVLTEGFQCMAYNITGSAINLDLTAVTSYINGTEAHTKIKARGMISIVYDATNVVYISGATEA